MGNHAGFFFVFARIGSSSRIAHRVLEIRQKRPELDTSSATMRKIFLFVAAHVSCAGGKDMDVLTELTKWTEWWRNCRLKSSIY